MEDKSGQMGFIDALSVISFLISFENLKLNATQEDMNKIQKELSDKAELLLKEIHGHLETQDQKINEILKRLDELKS